MKNAGLTGIVLQCEHLHQTETSSAILFKIARFCSTSVSLSSSSAGIVHKYCMVFIRFYTISIVSITERNRLKLVLKESSNN